jgi:hypothetical protein
MLILIRIFAVLLLVAGGVSFIVEMVSPELLATFPKRLVDYAPLCLFAGGGLYYGASIMSINRSAKAMFASGKLPDTGLSVKPAAPGPDGKERFEMVMNDGRKEADLLKLNKRWGTTTIVSDQRKTMIVLWVVTIIFNAMSLPAIVPVTKAMFAEKQWGLALVYLFPIIGLLFLAFTVRTTLQHRRFGKSYLELKNAITYVGGRLEGTIRSSVLFNPTGDYEVRFRCQEQYSTGTGKNRRTETRVHWDRNKRFSPASASAFNGIALEFDVPGETSESYDRHSRGRIQWFLSIKAPLEGVDYEAEFEVPVFFKRADVQSS